MIDLTKPVQTRDGRPVEIIKTDLQGTDSPVVAAVTNKDGGQMVAEYGADGTLSDRRPSDLDLINVPKKHTVWVNVYEDPRVRCRLYATRTEADLNAARSIRIACVKVTYEEGEGL